MFLREERVTYQEIKRWALNAYFDFCRDSGLMNGCSHEQVLARVDYIFEDGFERPVEDLMWRVILLVLSGGWHQEWEMEARQVIVKLLTKRGLNTLLLEVPEDEADQFCHDLRILKLI